MRMAATETDGRGMLRPYEKPARCPQCGAVADGLHIADGRLRAGTVIVTGWACGCGKVVHFGARDNKAVAK